MLQKNTPIRPPARHNKCNGLPKVKSDEKFNNTRYKRGTPTKGTLVEFCKELMVQIMVQNLAVSATGAKRRHRRNLDMGSAKRSRS